jgi:hypothetical protein
MLGNANRLETELFRTYWDDGLLDLVSGVALLTIGIGWYFQQVVLAAVAPALIWPLWAPLRRKLVEPRAGFVEFSHARKQHAHRSLRLALLLGAGAFLLGIGAFLYVHYQGMNSDYIRVFPAVPAALLAGGAFIGAQFTRARRFMIYGFVMLVAAGLTAVYDLGPAAPMLMGGIVVTLSGLSLLIRFLKASAQFEE